MIRRRLAAVVLLLALGALCGALASDGRRGRRAREGRGASRGRCSTPPRASPPRGAVTLYVGRRAGRGRGAEARETVADGEGRFAFAGAGAGARYQLTAVHQGVAYQTPVFALGSAAPLELRVYDVTGRDPGLRRARPAHLRRRRRRAPGGGRDPAADAGQPLAAAYRGDRRRPHGPPALRAAPSGRQLRPPLNLSRRAWVDRGFASSDPVLPGEGGTRFAYRFPYVAPVYA